MSVAHTTPARARSLMGGSFDALLDDAQDRLFDDLPRSNPEQQLEGIRRLARVEHDAEGWRSTQLVEAFSAEAAELDAGPTTARTRAFTGFVHQHIATLRSPIVAGDAAETALSSDASALQVELEELRTRSALHGYWDTLAREAGDSEQDAMQRFFAALELGLSREEAGARGPALEAYSIALTAHPEHAPTLQRVTALWLESKRDGASFAIDASTQARLEPFSDALHEQSIAWALESDAARPGFSQLAATFVPAFTRSAAPESPVPASFALAGQNLARGDIESARASWQALAEDRTKSLSDREDAAMLDALTRPAADRSRIADTIAICESLSSDRGATLGPVAGVSAERVHNHTRTGDNETATQLRAANILVVALWQAARGSLGRPECKVTPELLEAAWSMVDDVDERAALVQGWSTCWLTAVAQTEDQASTREAWRTTLFGLEGSDPACAWWREAALRSLFESGDPAAAAQLLHRWINDCPGGDRRTELLLRYGEVLEQRLQDIDAAAEVYARAHAHDPEDSEILRSLGRTQERLRRWSQVVATLERQAGQAGDDQERLVALRRLSGIAELRLGDPELAITTLQEVILRQPDDFLSMFQLAALARAQANPKVLAETLTALAKRVEDVVSKTAVLVELGELLGGRLERPDKARQVFEKALELSPGYVPAVDALETLLRHAGAYDDLIERLAAQTEDALGPMRAAKILIDDVGDVERAQKALAQASALDPSCLTAAFWRAELAGTAGDFRAVYRALSELPEPSGSPCIADRELELGQMAARTAQAEDDPAGYERALEHFMAALAIEPANALAFEEVRQILVERRDTKRLVELIDGFAHALDDGPLKGILAVQAARIRFASRREAESAGMPLEQSVADARSGYEEIADILVGDPVPHRELECLLWRSGSRDAIPSHYLHASRSSAQEQIGVALSIEAAELLMLAEGTEDRGLAQRLLLDALRRDPGNPHAVRHLERVIVAKDRPVAARDIVAARAARTQSTAERAIFFLESAELLEEDGHVEQAERAYRAADDALPGLVPADLGLDRLSRARRGTKSPPPPPPPGADAASGRPKVSVHNLMAEAREAVARHSRSNEAIHASTALTRISAVLERDSAHRDALSLLRMLTRQLDDRTPAVDLMARVFPKVIDRNVRYELGLMLGEFCTRAGQAAAYLQEARDARPDGTEALQALVQRYRELGDDARAAEAIEGLIKAYGADDARTIDLRLELATYLAQKAETRQQAADQLRSVLDERPEDRRATGMLVDVLEASGEFVRAAETLEGLIPGERDRTQLHRLYHREATLYHRAGANSEAATSAIEQAILLRPDHAETIDLLVQLFEQAGQRHKLEPYVNQIRSAMAKRIRQGRLQDGDFKLLSRISSDRNAGLRNSARSIDIAISATNVETPPQIARLTKTGLRRLLDDERARELLRSSDEMQPVYELLATLEPAVTELSSEFPAISAFDAAPIPASADPSYLSGILQSVSTMLDLSTPIPQGASTKATCIIIPGPQPELRISTDYWTHGEPAAWRGLAGVALARYAWGAPRARALGAAEIDLLLASCFEVSGIFNAITADPEPDRLTAVTRVISRRLSKRQRTRLHQACEQLSSADLVPGFTHQAVCQSDLRLASLLTGDVQAVLSAACIIDGETINRGPLLERINASALGRELVVFLGSDEFSELLRIASE